jgi:DNA-binding CsgD family transcriptional regulator
MTNKLRKSGIPVLGRILWGAHLCLFYETKQDLIDSIATYFAAGLKDNEYCLWLVSDPLDLHEARAALARDIPGFADYEAAGRIELLAGADWYFDGSNVALEKITRGLKDKLRAALKNGFEGLRASGNALWQGTDHWQSFMDYEKDVEESLAGQRVLALCTYWLEASSGAELLSVAKSHDIALARRRGAWELIEAVSAPSVSGPLSAREIEVLTWAARGKSAWETGEIMSISKRTVDEHAYQAMRKLGASNRIQAVAIAVRNRLIDPNTL